MNRPVHRGTTIWHLMALTAFVAAALRLTLRPISPDTVEFFEIMLGVAGLLVLFLVFDFGVWAVAVGLIAAVRRVVRRRG